MKTFILSLTLFLTFTISASADDVTDVRSTIERHYAAINSQENETVYGHHLPSFTMYGADGGILWEADALETTERMKADLPWPHLQVRMANFNAQVYGDVAVATFYLVGTVNLDGNLQKVNNRVSAVWVKKGNEWKEAHHHESPLAPN